MSNENKHDDKTFLCNICEKKFEFRVYLKNHIKRTHTESIHHRCDICGSIFAFKNKLSTHINGTHVTQNKRKLESVKKNNEYQECDICDEELSKKSMKQHKASSHKNGKHFQCEFCNNTFSTMHELTKHIDGEHTKSKPF